MNAFSRAMWDALLRRLTIQKVLECNKSDRHHLDHFEQISKGEYFEYSMQTLAALLQPKRVHNREHDMQISF
jgi:hypothetical protein